MTLCNQCNAPLSRADAAFCPHCGARQAATPYLTLQQPGALPQTIPLARLPLTIGREPACDISIDQTFVSRTHARIEARDGRFWIIDTNSTNGVYVDNSRMPQAVLNDGAIVRIGDKDGNAVTLRFSDGRPAPSVNPATMSRRLDSLQLGSQQMVTIGRDPSCQIVLDHPTVSRRHAEMRPTPDGRHLLRDLGSANHTYLDGVQVGSTPVALRAGSVVQIGPFRLTYDGRQLTQYTSQGNYRIDAIKLVRDVPDGKGGQKRILTDVSLSIEPREFVALVGGSGAGKSTLMKALAGIAPANGRVLVNGEELYANFGVYRSAMGYVPQDDIIHRQLTVGSALRYAAELRLPDATPQEIAARIERVLQEVELVGHTETPVERLSGGQRKRVSIAAELLAEPGLFFLDEPTSGLDPGLEKKMMYTLRTLADGGRTIVLVTHATANIDQCTQVAFLGRGGQIAYYGPPAEANGFFNAHDFADIYTRISDAQPLERAQLNTAQLAHFDQLAAQNGSTPPPPPNFWAHFYQHSPQYSHFVAQRQAQLPPPPPPRAPEPLSAAKQRAAFVQQFGVLARRYFELIWRDWLSLGILLAVMPVIGVLLLLMTTPHALTGLPPGPRNGDGDGCPRNVRPENARTIYEHIQCEIAEARDDGDGESYQGTYAIVPETQRVLFIMALAPTLLGIFASAYEIIKEEPIYQRERLVNLRIWPYLLSKTAVLGLFALLQAVLFLFVLSWKLDFPLSRDGGVFGFLPPVVEIYITLVLTTLASIGLGLAISAAVRAAGTVIYVILVLLFVQILFAGAIFDIPPATQPISMATITRWSLEGLGATVDLERLKARSGGCIESEGVQDIPEARREPEAEEFCDAGQLYMASEHKFHINYDSTPGHLLFVWLVLLAFAAGLHGLTWALQRRKDIV